MHLDELLTGLAHLKGSDLYFTADSPPLYRVDGATVPAFDHVLEAGEVERIIRETLPAKDLEEFDRTNELNAARLVPGVGRFRLNVFRQRGQVGLVARLIPIDFPNADDLGLPASLLELIMSKRGLVLVTGATGSGKSTTLAALIDHRNLHSRGHILTIEDPIEFVHMHKGCVVTQREVGVDTASFAAGLKSALRQAPDVILIGEMRDAETVSAAISAAETGHLVFSTLHTVNAVQTVERIITFFPPHQHELVRLQLALNLAGVCSLRLVKNKDGTAMVPAVEMLINTPTVRELLEQGQTRMLPKALNEGSYYGTMTFNQSLIRLFQAGNISLEDALASSDNPDELKMQMRGITQGSAASRPGT
jgi:pilus retraction protein PilT